MIELFFALVSGHALADFALQPGIMAKLKNRHNKPDDIPQHQKYVPCWMYWLLSHSFIHGGVVYFITGSVVLGVIETIAHSVIDFTKCEGRTNPHQDQFLHIGCRVGYLFY